MISIPVFTADTYLATFNYYQNFVDSMQNVIDSTENFDDTNTTFLEYWSLLVDENKEKFNMKLLKLQLNQKKSESDVSIVKEYKGNEDLNLYRNYELEGI